MSGESVNEGGTPALDYERGLAESDRPFVEKSLESLLSDFLPVEEYLAERSRRGGGDD